jgi:hypothetical protein
MNAVIQQSFPPGTRRTDYSIVNMPTWAQVLRETDSGKVFGTNGPDLCSVAQVGRFIWPIPSNRAARYTANAHDLGCYARARLGPISIAPWISTVPVQPQWHLPGSRSLLGAVLYSARLLLSLQSLSGS